MAVDECEEDNPPKPCAQEGMLRRIPPKNTEVPRVLPVGLHYLKEDLKWNYIFGFMMIVGGSLLIFKKW
jgi:hypothetical protein